MAREVAGTSTVMLAERGQRRLTMSYDEFSTWADEDVHAEWADDEVTVFTPASDCHQAILGLLHILVSLYSWRLNLGEVRFAPFEMRLSHAVREPDLLFVARAHRDRLTPRRLDGPADLVVELISDDSVQRDRVEKLRDYEAAGIPEYWLCDSRPRHEHAAFNRLTEQGTYQAVPLDASGRFHSLALPGFWLDPTWLWQDPLPNPETLLAMIMPQS
jgi:Uma2 family endonuclease